MSPFQSGLSSLTFLPARRRRSFVNSDIFGLSSSSQKIAAISSLLLLDKIQVVELK
jgi:hypothetical protein